MSNEPLNYQPASATQPSVLKVIGGVATAAAGIAIAVAMALMYLGNSGLAGIGGVLAGFIILAVKLKRQPRWRSFAIGLWIGIGLILLIEGVCWVALDRALRS